jgi:hypothetical protein
MRTINISPVVETPGLWDKIHVPQAEGLVFCGERDDADAIKATPCSRSWNIDGANRYSARFGQPGRGDSLHGDL